MSRNLDLPDDADSITVEQHPDGVHVTLEVYDDLGGMLESHTYAHPDAEVDP